MTLDRAKAEHLAGVEAQQRATAHFAERDSAIREVLNAPGPRPSQRAIAEELGISAQRVAQIALKAEPAPADTSHASTT